MRRELDGRDLALNAAREYGQITHRRRSGRVGFGAINQLALYANRERATAIPAGRDSPRRLLPTLARRLPRGKSGVNNATPFSPPPPLLHLSSRKRKLFYRVNRRGGIVTTSDKIQSAPADIQAHFLQIDRERVEKLRGILSLGLSVSGVYVCVRANRDN